MTKMAGSCSTRFVPAQFRSNFSTFFSMIFRFGKGREVRLKTSKPLILRAFLVCRNYTVRAHLRNPGPAKRSGCENRLRHAGPLQCRVHPGHLRPCDYLGPAAGGGSDGTRPLRQFIALSSPEKFPYGSESGSDLKTKNKLHKKVAENKNNPLESGDSSGFLVAGGGLEPPTSGL